MVQTRGAGYSLYLLIIGAASAPVESYADPPRSLHMRGARKVAQAPAPDEATPSPLDPAAAVPAPADAAERVPARQAAGELSEAEFAKLAEEQSKEEVIIVTGSTIGRKSLTTPAPLTILDRELLYAAGQATLGDVVQQELPVQSNAANGQLNLGGDGATRVNLRGLGVSRTLTLINGRRVVSGGWGANTAVDFNAIPLAIVERVEVLKDGASAVYGSDAIGGVVNIITRSDYEGSEATLFTSGTQRSDGFSYDASFVTGYNSENKKGNIVFSAGLQNQRPIFAGDRSFSANDMTYDFTNKVAIPGGSTAVPDGRINTRAIDVNGDGRPDPVDLCGAQFCTSNGAGGYRPFAPPVDLYNYQPLTYLYTPSSRYHLYSAGAHKLTSEISTFFEGSYANTKSAQQFAAESFVNTVPISKDSMYNPLGGTVLGYQRRLAEFGPRRNPENMDTFRVVGGIKGKIPDDSRLFRNFKWELSYDYGRTDARVEAHGNLIVSRLASAVGPSFMSAAGVPTCGTPTKPIPGCVPMNILGPLGAIDPAAADYVTFTGIGKGFNQQQTTLAQAHGRLLKLPNNGDLSIAMGGDLRRESGGFTPDPVSAAGDSTGTAIAPTKGAYQVIEGFSELSLVPVSGKPLAEWLEISLAARAFRYNTFGSGVTWKTGALYRPINAFALRGTFSTAFRAPAISELYQGTTAGLLPGSDPCDTRPFGSTITLDPGVAAECANQGVPTNAAFGSTLTRQQARSNADLGPETAKVLTAGIVIEPPQVKGLSLTADYWRIDIDNAIQRLSMNVVFANCYTRHVQSDCEQIHRNPFAGYTIDYIDLPMENVGGALKTGLDFALSYDHKFGAAGRFREQFESQYLLKADLDNTAQVLHGLNNTDLGAHPRVRANLSSLWQHPSGIGAGVTLRYVGAYRECDQNNCNGGAAARDIARWYKADLFGSYSVKTVAGLTSLTVGVTNVLDRAPPPIYGAPLGDYDPTGYDHRGRSFYARMSQAF
jgi:iron complex outermembrane receptor protein